MIGQIHYQVRPILYLVDEADVVSDVVDVIVRCLYNLCSKLNCMIDGRPIITSYEMSTILKGILIFSFRLVISLRNSTFKINLPKQELHLPERALQILVGSSSFAVPCSIKRAAN